MAKMLQSSIAWIDFAEQDRRKMVEVLSLFRLRDTRDELGLSSIRDTFANLFFPGTTTLQTRARYFLFIPWIYLYFEKRRVPSHRIPDRLKRYEVRLIEALTKAGEEGVIGGISGASLQRFPASIYWNGLEQWGIRRFPGSQSQYHRWLDHFYRHQQDHHRPEDGESLAEGVEANWDHGLPDPPDGFPDSIGFDLTSEEARYLRERLLLTQPDSLLATLVESCHPVENVAFIWHHPELAQFPVHQRRWITHARNLSETMHGAVLLYNLMLAELKKHPDLIAEHRPILSTWWQGLNARIGGLSNWDRDAFWKLVWAEGQNVPHQTERFVSQWLDVLLSAQSVSDLSRHRPACDLVRHREVWLKRGRSRFESRRHLEMWSGRSGLTALDYRWPIAHRITNDLLRGLGRQ
jgi:hypothetical protein